MRLFLGAAGIGIIIWLVFEVCSGEIHFSQSSEEITTGVYVARSVEAILLAVMTFGGLACDHV